MPNRFRWNQHEVALLIDAYIRVAEGANLGQTAEWLSQTLRKLATQSGQVVDETYRNINGMKMQLANAQYLFTDGEKGLSGASAMIRQMYDLYKTNHAEYQAILKEAVRLTSLNVSIEEAFFAYAKKRIGLSPRMLADYLQKTADYCHLKQSLLGMTDVKAVRNAQQKVAEGKLLRFQYGKDAKTIRNVVQLYYTFIKSYHESKEEPPVQVVVPESEKGVPIPEETGEEWIIHELRTQKIPYVDKRSAGGCLWIASDISIPIALKEAENRGYRLHFKQDGCRAFPNRPVMWTKNRPQQPKPAILPGRDSNMHSLYDFRTFLVQNRHLAERTAGNYWTSIRMIEEYIRRNGLSYSLVNATSSDVQSVVDALMSQPDFVRMNEERHHQYSAAMAQYVSYLGKRNQTTDSANEQNQMTLSDLTRDNVVKMEENDSLLAEIRKRILSVVSESFPHGIRPASIIDINKLKRAYKTKFDEGLPANIDIASLLMSAGIESGEKIYFLSEDQKQSMRNLITSIIENGHRVIYYSELLSRHSELFEACHIYESLLMRTALSSIMPTYIYKTDWMIADRDANAIDEVTWAFGEDIVLTYQQVKSRRPYLPLGVIRWALSRSNRFVWSSPETYAQADLIELNQAEVSDIINHILPLIREKGYFSLAQLPIEESCGMNPQVSSSAVRDAIYNRYMSNEFTRNGLIVKLPRIHLNTYQLIVAWLKGLEQVTLTEVEDYERELTGHHAVLAIAAASSTMVRIDHDHYVSDASIRFDVDAVDHAISLFAGSRIIPITAITSYTSFPDVPGYNWNLYLVESFLRRFSKRFTIDGGPAQMSYVGGISSADRHFASYEDRLAHAVIQDGVTLTEEAIGRYLTDRKYILRRSETVRKTLDRARILNEQRGESSVRV